MRFNRSEVLSRSLVDWSSYERFYREEFDPYLPPNPQWRHWRVRCADGAFRKWWRTVRTKDDIRAMALELCAIDIYYSTACWLGAKSVAGRRLDGRKGSSYRYASRLLLAHDLFLDFDSRDLAGEYDAVVAEVRWCLQHVKAELEYVDYTAGKGFGLSYNLPVALPAEPAARLQAVTEARTAFIKELRRHHPLPHLDDQTSTNPFAVRRLPGSINSNTGRVAIILDPRELV